MEVLQLPTYDFKIRNSGQKPHSIFDDVRKKYVKLTPEEWVRQHVVKYLVDLGYPMSLMQLEKEMELFSTRKRFDVLVNTSSASPLLLVECKAPKVKIDQGVFDQITRYNVELGAPLLLITNGLQHYCANFDGHKYHMLDSMPTCAEAYENFLNFER